MQFSLMFIAEGPNWQFVSIGSGNGLVPSRHQAITWTSDDLVHMMSWGHNELIRFYEWP